MVENRNNLRNYASVITDFPEADIQSESIRGWILQGANHQLVFFHMEADAKIPEHDHEYPEWMIMIEGEIELTAEDITSRHKKGDEILIPTHTKHRARFLTNSRLAALFSERARYRTISLTRFCDETARKKMEF